MKQASAGYCRWIDTGNKQKLAVEIYLDAVEIYLYIVPDGHRSLYSMSIP